MITFFIDRTIVCTQCTLKPLFTNRRKDVYLIKIQKRVKPRNPQYILLYYLIEYTLGILSIEISHFISDYSRIQHGFNVQCLLSMRNAIFY